MNNNIIEKDQVCFDHLDQNIQLCISEKLEVNNNCYTNSDTLCDADECVVKANTSERTEFLLNMTTEIIILPMHFIMMSKLKAIF